MLQFSSSKTATIKQKDNNMKQFVNYLSSPSLGILSQSSLRFRLMIHYSFLRPFRALSLFWCCVVYHSHTIQNIDRHSIHSIHNGLEWQIDMPLKRSIIFNKRCPLVILKRK